MGISPLQNEKGEHVIDSKEKAEILNSQYNSVFTTEDLNNIPDLGPSNTNNIRPLEISKTGIEKQLKQLNPSKANGPDELPSRILKETHAEISPFLAKVFQQSYNTGQVPADWKQANISAIYKKGDRSQAVNYRPVSLTSICCKIMKHVIYRHIMEHLESNQILSDNQHGFRSNRSCETQLVNTIKAIAREIDHRGQMDMLILDFSKAFDTVPHQRLLYKMSHYGITSNTLLSTMGISMAYQETTTGLCRRESSRNIPVRSGVPQGTDLGPLCFLIYINDMGNSISRKTTPRLFADDSLLYRSIKTIDDRKQLQDLTTLNKWAETWKMTFHPAKCYIL